MATNSVTWTGSYGQYSRLYIELTLASQSVANNTSTFAYKVRGQSTDVNAGILWDGGSLQLSNAYSKTKSIGSGSFNYTTEFVFDSGTFTVGHDAEGKLSTRTLTAYVTLTSGHNATVSVSLSVPTIDRASSFTLSGSTRTNADINVTIAKKSSSFNHRVRWRISGSASWKTVQDSSWSGTSTSFKVQPSDIPNSKSKEIVVGVQTYSGSNTVGSEVTSRRIITIPNTTISLSGTANTGSSQTVNISNSGGSLTFTRSWSLGNASAGNVASWTPAHSALPSATSGTLWCTVVTKNGTATINTVSATRTIAVPASVMPSVGTIAHAEQNSTVSSLVGAYVQNMSLIKFTPTFTAGSGATISSTNITFRSQTTNKSTLTATANSAGDLVCSATVTDSRGRTATNSVTITVLPYENPIVTGVSFIRSNADGTPNTIGTYLTIKATIRVRRLIVGSTEKNKIWYQSQSARVGQSYTTKTDLASQAGSISGNYRQSVYTHTFSGYPIDYPYSVRVRGGDIFSWSGYIAGTIPTGVVLQHWGESTTAFGKMIDDVNYNVLVGAKGMKSEGSIIDKNGNEVLSSVATLIPSNANLNNYDKEGLYYNPSNANVGTMSNSPLARSFAMLVMKHAGVAQIWIEYVANGNQRIFTRNRYGTSWSNWLEIYHSGNLPHQIETGSNSSGEYVKYPDGTMICWARRNLGTAAATNGQVYDQWNYPKAFISIPTVTFTPEMVTTGSGNALHVRFGMGTVQTNLARAGIENNTSSQRQFYANWHAIGRWK